MSGLTNGLALCPLGTPTPYLTSPLRGGRDELGERGLGLARYLRGTWVW